jgi:hypothetical protein
MNMKQEEGEDPLDLKFSELEVHDDLELKESQIDQKQKVSEPTLGNLQYDSQSSDSPSPIKTSKTRHSHST